MKSSKTFPQNYAVPELMLQNCSWNEAALFHKIFHSYHRMEITTMTNEVLYRFLLYPNRNLEVDGCPSNKNLFV